MLDMGEVRRFAGRVDDEEQPVRPARDHEIVADAAARVGELGVAHAIDTESLDVARHQRFERPASDLAAAQLRLAHMRHVEQRRPPWCGTARVLSEMPDGYCTGMS